MAKSFCEDLAEDFKSLYETKERCDTIINVGKEPNVEQIYAHSVILCTRSSYFRTALSDKWAKEDGGYLVLSKPNISAFTFKIILKFLYCGIVDLESQEIEIIFELLIAADELSIQKFTSYIQEFLIENSYKFLLQSLMKMLHFIVHNQFDELKEAYVETICENPDLLFDSEEFLSLEEDALKLILKCDNLDIKESVIWNKLVKWGIAQCKTLENNMICDDTKNEDIDKLEEILQELIQLIRFYQIDPKEFIPEVWEYKQLLPDKVIKDILHCHLDPDAKPLYHTFPIRWGNFKVDSHFNLLFRNSSDGGGLSSHKFHQNCDNKGATIVIAKIKDKSWLIGGYNPLDWNGNDVWKQTTDSFLFVLNIDTLKGSTSYVDHSSYAIYCNSGCGPSFGEGPDFRISNDGSTFKYRVKSYHRKLVNSNNPDSHELSKLSITDYEVFQIVSNISTQG